MTALEGKMAPGFELEGSDGKKHSLCDYAGRSVVLYFYPKDNTPGCTKEACRFKDLHQEVDEIGVVLLGISKDSTKSHESFINKFSLPFTLLSDPSGETMKAYGAIGEKVMYGKKTVGTIRSTVVVGTDGKIVKHWPSVKKAETHPDEVVEFLHKMQSQH
jgi:peroxiredoxin Q/BCP